MNAKRARTVMGIWMFMMIYSAAGLTLNMLLDGTGTQIVGSALTSAYFALGALTTYMFNRRIRGVYVLLGVLTVWATGVYLLLGVGTVVSAVRLRSPTALAMLLFLLLEMIALALLWWHVTRQGKENGADVRNCAS